MSKIGHVDNGQGNGGLSGRRNVFASFDFSLLLIDDCRLVIRGYKFCKKLLLAGGFQRNVDTAEITSTKFDIVNKILTCKQINCRKKTYVHEANGVHIINFAR